VLGYWGREESGDQGRFRALIGAEVIVRMYDWGGGWHRLNKDEYSLLETSDIAGTDSLVYFD